MNYEIGDVVKIKSGVKDVDFDWDLGGWQGRVDKVFDDGSIQVAWDSITLRDMPSKVITKCEEEGLDWTVYILDHKEVEPAEARDTPADVRKVVQERAKNHAWDWMEEEGEITRQVLAGIDPNNDSEMMKTWRAYMEEHLSFPFEAEVFELQGRSSLNYGDHVLVRRISGIHRFYGVLVRVRKGRRQFKFPLCDLRPLDETSENHKIVYNYGFWYTNR